MIKPMRCQLKPISARGLALLQGLPTLIEIRLTFALEPAGLKQLPHQQLNP